MATRSQRHGTRWLKFGSIQMIKAVCTVATVTKENVPSALCQSVQIVACFFPCDASLTNTVYTASLSVCPSEELYQIG